MMLKFKKKQFRIFCLLQGFQHHIIFIQLHLDNWHTVRRRKNVPIIKVRLQNNCMNPVPKFTPCAVQNSETRHVNFSRTKLTGSGYGSGEQRTDFFVASDRQHDVARGDPLLLQVLGDSTRDVTNLKRVIRLQLHRLYSTLDDVKFVPLIMPSLSCAILYI